MTKQRALIILIDNAAKNVAGVGVGIRPEITREARAEVRDAVLRLWRDVYDFACGDDDLGNLGLPPAMTDGEK